MSGNFNWKKSFAQDPVMVVAKGDEILYRVAGLTSFGSLPWGSFFTPKKPTCVSHAESMLNIVNYGNTCACVATYRVNQGVILWKGKVRHGKKDIADFSAEQVYIEGPLFGKIELIKDIEPLRQDIFVWRGSGTV